MLIVGVGETEPARMVAVIAPAKDFEVNGKAIKEEHINGSEEKDWDYKQLEKQEGKLWRRLWTAGIHIHDYMKMRLHGVPDMFSEL
jgi:hypothetical protein